IPLHGSEMLCNLGRGIEDASVLHVSDEHGEQTEDHEEHKFGVRTRPAHGCDDGGHLIFPQVPMVSTQHTQRRGSKWRNCNLLYPFLQWPVPDWLSFTILSMPEASQ